MLLVLYRILLAQLFNRTYVGMLWDFLFFFFAGRLEFLKKCSWQELRKWHGMAWHGCACEVAGSIQVKKFIKFMNFVGKLHACVCVCVCSSQIERVCCKTHVMNIRGKTFLRLCSATFGGLRSLSLSVFAEHCAKVIEVYVLLFAHLFNLTLFHLISQAFDRTQLETGSFQIWRSKHKIQLFFIFFLLSSENEMQ